jgi:DNA-binding transcriptional ArsR family regulator
VAAVRIDFSGVGRLLASSPRSAILVILLRGGAASAGELAREAGVAPSTASEHLAALAQGGLVRSTSIGRHRYYTLAEPRVAEALESLATLCPPLPSNSLRRSVAAQELRFARTCYDHLAGMLGVALLDALLARGWLSAEDGLLLMPRGKAGLERMGIDVSPAQRSKRIFARACLDWSEKRFNLAGALGAAITNSMLQQGWFMRLGTGRGLEVTDRAQAGLRELGVAASVLESTEPGCAAL